MNKSSYIVTTTPIFSVVALFLFSFNSNATVVNPQPGDSVWTLVKRLGNVFDEKTIIFISNDDATAGVITLSQPGNYRLKENIVNRIVISSDGVCLDLHWFKVSINDTTENVITVNSTTQRVLIFNGNVCNTDTKGSKSGIFVDSGSSFIFINNVRVFDCGNGINLNGQGGAEIENCEITSCCFLGNNIGINLSFANKNIIKKCCASRSMITGFEVFVGESNCFYDCQALKTEGDATVVGFKSSDGCSNLFQRCVTKKTKTSAQEFCNVAYGFLLTGTERKTKIIDCIINETDVTSTVSAIACGISLDGVILPFTDPPAALGDLLFDIDSENHSASLESVAWSPNGTFLAIGGSVTGGVSHRVYNFDGTILTLVDSENHGSLVISVAWSPNGKFLAIGGFPGTGDFTHRVYSFDGTTLTLVDSANHGDGVLVISVAWSPDGTFLAIGGDPGAGSFTHRVYSFDGTTLTLVDSADHGTTSVNSIAWTPDGKFLAIGGGPGTGSFTHRVYSFNGTTLALIDSETQAGSFILSIAWSPNGKFLAIGGFSATGTIPVYSFDSTTLSLVTAPVTPSLGVHSVDWSPNGKFLAIGTDGLGGFTHRLFSFDGTTLTVIASADHGASVQSVDWSPNSKYLAIAGGIIAGVTHRVLDAMNAPQNCFLQNNVIADTAAVGQFVGTGIRAGGNNGFINNIGYNNEVNFTYGIPNVFFDNHPYDITNPADNISKPPL